MSVLVWRLSILAIHILPSRRRTSRRTSRSHFENCLAFATNYTLRVPDALLNCSDWLIKTIQTPPTTHKHSLTTISHYYPGYSTMQKRESTGASLLYCSTLMSEKLPNQVNSFQQKNCPNGTLPKVGKFLPWVPEVFFSRAADEILRFGSAVSAAGTSEAAWRFFSRGSPIQTWPIPETAHEKPLAARVENSIQTLYFGWYLKSTTAKKKVKSSHWQILCWRFSSNLSTLRPVRPQ